MLSVVAGNESIPEKAKKIHKSIENTGKYYPQKK